MKMLDTDVQIDSLRRLDEVSPCDKARDRHIEGNTAAHLKASTVGAPQTVIKQKREIAPRSLAGFIFVNLTDS